MALDDRALLKYAGAFARGRAGAHELRAILADYFRVTVRVVPLSGQWLNLPADALTRLEPDPETLWTEAEPQGRRHSRRR